MRKFKSFIFTVFIISSTQLFAQPSNNSENNSSSISCSVSSSTSATGGVNDCAVATPSEYISTTSVTVNISKTNDHELVVYVKATCPHCAEAKKYLPKLAQDYPQLTITYKDIEEESNNLKELIAISEKTKNWPPGVPTFVFRGNAISGFTDETTSAPLILKLLSPMIKAQSYDNSPTSVESKLTAKTEYKSDFLGMISVERFGLPAFAFVLGLIDGFNPCAMWVLLFLLSFLINMHDRKKMALIAGTFVFVSGAVYFAFMAAWLNFFLFIGGSKVLGIILGLTAIIVGFISIRDFIRESKEFTLSIPSGAKPGIFQRMRAIMQKQSTLAMLFSVAALAIVVNFYELLCTAGIPAIFTAVLANQEITGISYYGYLLIYILAYILDDSIMVIIAVWTLSSNKLTQKAGKWLKLISGIVMVLLGLALLFFPQLLQ